MEVKKGTDRSVTRTSIWYGVVVFTSSACLLVLEIVAGRLLAPYIGVSLYTWTSIIGVILAGLALGNWLGGRLADGRVDDWVVGAVLAASGVSSLAVLFLLMIVAPWIQAIVSSLLAASLLYVAALFFIPAMFLGVITPLVITLNLAISVNTGRVVGRLHALAALGSIAGTFVTGYWLVQWFGTRAIVMSTGVILVAMAVPFLCRKVASLVTVIVAAAFAITLSVAVNGLVNPCDDETRYYCIRIVEEDIGQAGDTGLSMVLDHMTHSTNHLSQPDNLITPYVQAMDELIYRFFPGSRLENANMLFAGGGAYTHPRAIRASYPEVEVTVVELDPAVTAAAERRMAVDTSGMTILHGDIGRVLSVLPANRFDVVVLDVFHDLAIPYHLATSEFFESVRQKLKDDGLFLINVVDVFPDPKLVKALIKTLHLHFGSVDLWMERPPEEEGRLTYVLSARDRGNLPDRLSSRKGVARTWYRLTDAVVATGTSLSGIPEITSDYAPVERLLSPLFTTRSGL
jgi:spermidine synthase